ncbi:sigma-70 family RNA polymerase sigma factor [Acetobacter sp.]|uniref:sigma-70 family RNA polymerase sigma factor n=1 Tax=Acetobacter sp. TaxID=440 RepID=UPI00387EE446|nr:sigma-70 family RNA polymerase sigma factor [Acetobacter sp.]MCI1299792.1 sigma-70 family RNA polymerase sigma factor [Acetobacter sp.]MCI1315810.1 sigma-70 family RNA polymerase sigma factor [Acetobacter sp.]
MPELRAFARFLTKDRTRADDLVQEAVVRVFASRDQFSAETNLKAWSFTILRNFFYEQARRCKREQEILSEYQEQPLVSASSGEKHDEVNDLNKLLWELPDDQREALMLVGAQELSYEEAAAICGVSAGTIKSRVSRARAFLVSLRDEGAG